MGICPASNLDLPLHSLALYLYATRAGNALYEVLEQNSMKYEVHFSNYLYKRP